MKTRFIAFLLTVFLVSINSANAQVKVSTKGGLKVTSGDYTVQIGGRLQYDYNRSEENGEVDEDQFDDRRARLFVKGKVAKDWGYKINFNVDGSGFEDLYIRYTGFGKGAVVTVGNQLQPFTLSQLISSKDIGISERPGIAERYLIGRREGVQVHGDINKWHYAVGVFTDESEEDDAVEDAGFAGRLTYAPVKSDRNIVHLGFAYRDTEDLDGFGIEAAGVSGPFHVQAEYFDAEESDGQAVTDIDGYYVQVGYVLTGEVRPYKNGTFTRIKPARKSGAWEVVARYEDGDGGFGDIELGNTNATSYALGVNYYVNDYVRINASYQDGESNITDDDGNEIRVRFQVAF